MLKDQPAMCLETTSSLVQLKNQVRPARNGAQRQTKTEFGRALNALSRSTRVYPEAMGVKGAPI